MGLESNLFKLKVSTKKKISKVATSASGFPETFQFFFQILRKCKLSLRHQSPIHLFIFIYLPELARTSWLAWSTFSSLIRWKRSLTILFSSFKLIDPSLFISKTLQWNDVNVTVCFKERAYFNNVACLMHAQLINHNATL